MEKNLDRFQYGDHGVQVLEALVVKPKFHSFNQVGKLSGNLRHLPVLYQLHVAADNLHVRHALHEGLRALENQKQILERKKAQLFIIVHDLADEKRNQLLLGFDHAVMQGTLKAAEESGGGLVTFREALHQKLGFRAGVDLLQEKEDF